MSQTHTTETKAPEIVHPYIECKSDVLCGEPIIRGTRIGVRHIVEWDRMDYSVDEIVAMYPHLTHAHVHDALSYYFDHKSEIDRLIEENAEASVRQKHSGGPWMK